MTTNALSPTVHVLGAGSMGMMIAARLQAVAPVMLIRRQGNRPAELELQVRHGEEITSCRLPQCSSDALPNRVTHLILCTKAHDALPALESLGAGLADDAQLLLMQNGMGSQEAVAKRFPRARVAAATTTEGAYRAAPDCVVHAARGLTRIGPLNGGDFDWVGLFRKAGFEAETVADILWHLADKLRVNALINPLTAVHGCLNGELLERRELLAQMEQLGREADAVLASAGFIFATASLDQAMAVARTTAANRSSMLQDVTAGRQTEVEDITGYLLAMARRRGIEAPAHARLYQRLTSASRRRG